jgi:carbonic anhydrase
MDPRVPVEQLLNINYTDAVIARNAGGRIKAGLRDLLILDTLSGGQVIKEVVVIHHTDCGCTHISDDVINQRLKEWYPGAEKDVSDIWFGTFGAGDVET